MPNPDAPPLTRAVMLRGAGFAVAVALGAVAVWLIVIADSTKSMRLGVLAGIWGALLGAYSMFGARRHGLEAEAMQHSVSDVPVLTAQEIAVRSHGEVERIAEAAARRAFEDRLEQMLRRELSREVADVRSEIARLRQDLLDKVGGQLRLERIETTRVIGSDLEALQHEVRQLKQASETGTLHELGLGTLRKVVEPARVRPISRPAAEVEADVQPARVPDDAAPSPAVGREPAPEPAPSHPSPAPVVAPARAAVSSTPAVAPIAPLTPAAAATATVPAVHVPAASVPWSPPSNAARTTAASSNGASSNGASANGPSSNGRSGRTDRRAEVPAPAPVETTGPIRVTPPATSSRSETPAAPAASTPTPTAVSGVRPAAAAPAPAPARPAESRPGDSHPTVQPPGEPWTPPSAPATSARQQPPVRAAAVPKPEPAAPAAPRSSDPFASLPRITPFTEFELDPIDTTSHADERPHTDAPADPVSPVAPASSAYTGRRRRTGDGDPDPGRHSRSEPAPVEDVVRGRRRRPVETEVEPDDDDLLSRLLARGSAEH